MTKDIRLYLENQHSDKIKSLKDISYDSANGEYLSNLTEQCMDYDKVIANICCGDTLASADAIYFKDNKICFIEFKNGKIFDGSGKEQRRQIKLKITEGSCIGLYEIARLAGMNMDFGDIINIEKMYLVVYNQDKLSTNADKIRAHMNSKLGLLIYKGTFLNEIEIVNSTTFDRVFKGKVLWN